jgi:hypothetical protein
MLSKRLSLAVALGGLFVARGAVADPYDGDYDGPSQDPAHVYGYGWHEPGLQSDIGVGVTVGGGVSGFTDQAMRDTTTSKVSGLWDLRVSIGTHVPIGVDISYVGTAANVESLGRDNGTLIGTTVEGALRFNILPHYKINPYIFAGIGYQRYDLRSPNFAQSDSGMQDSSDFAEFPMGTGISYRDRTGFTADVRGTFRAAANSNLLTDTNGTKADMHTWEASAALGYEF